MCLSDETALKSDNSNKNDLEKFPSSRQYDILLVDDSPDVTFTFKVGLEKDGFARVDVFNDPLLALTSFKPGSYDLLLLDIKMPKMNGFELYQSIRKKEKNVKTCFISAYEVYYETLKKEFPSLDIGCFISKPIEMDELIRRIKAELQEQ